MSFMSYVKDIFQNPQRYTKFWTALSGSVVTYLVARYGHTPEITLVTGFLTALSVLQTSNGE